MFNPNILKSHRNTDSASASRSGSGSDIAEQPRHDDLAACETYVASSDDTLAGSNTNFPKTPPPTRRPTLAMLPGQEQEKTENHLVLSEYEIICRSQICPSDGTPIELTFGPYDLDNPMNWSPARKWYIACFVSLLNVLTCLVVGGYSSAVPLLKEQYHISNTTGTLGLSTYILGFAFGPLLLAPLSEHWGRNPIYIWSWLLLVLLQIPAALAQSASTIIGVRFLQGFVGSAPLTNTGGTIADLWERDQCGGPMAIYGLSSTLGPPLALPLTGYLAERQGWRVLFWFFMAVVGAAWILMVATLPETRHTIILAKKTHRLRKQLSSQTPLFASAIVPPPRTSLSHLFKVTLTRPIRFLFTEPITFSAALYNGLIYGIVFLFNEAFPLVFENMYDFTPAEASLTFLGLCVGSIVASFFHPIQERHYLTVRTPESRMWLSLPACFLLPVSLFWFGGCTAGDGTHWIVPIIASTLFGAGIFVVVLGVLNFVVDSYGAYAASSLAGVILVRNIVGAMFPLFARAMYNRLGYMWAGFLLGFLALAFCVIPFVFYFYGKEIRRRSPWASRNEGATGHTALE